jgi:hypothetical protein
MYPEISEANTHFATSLNCKPDTTLLQSSFLSNKEAFRHVYDHADEFRNITQWFAELTNTTTKYVKSTTPKKTQITGPEHSLKVWWV